LFPFPSSSDTSFPPNDNSNYYSLLPPFFYFLFAFIAPLFSLSFGLPKTTKEKTGVKKKKGTAHKYVNWLRQMIYFWHFV
jgi:hypothetical protein